jgi:large subunit ribosomal protein L25
MKTVEIIGYKRANLGKTESKRLRQEGYVPGVLYGGEKQIHFYAPTILFRDAVYTSDAHFVELNIEGDIHQAILQDIQFHPVSETIMHADFLEIFAGKPIKMTVPVHLEGSAPGLQQGGTLIRKRKFVDLKGLPKNMPDYVMANISKLGLGASIKVKDLPAGEYEILTPGRITLASIEIPRAMRGKTVEGEEGAEEGAEEATAEAAAE